MTFHVGQKVVCIDAKLRAGNGNLDGLTQGRVYTVRCLVGGMRVEEIVRRQPRMNIRTRRLELDLPYYADRFRPVVSRPTSIAIFTAMLNPSQVTVDAMNTADFARESAG